MTGGNGADSWARMYLYTEGGSFSTTLQFYYLWTNESPEVAIVSIDAPLLVTGTVFARGSSAFFGGNVTDVGGTLVLDPVKWTGWEPTMNGGSQVNYSLRAFQTTF